MTKPIAARVGIALAGPAEPLSPHPCDGPDEPGVGFGAPFE